MKIAAIAICCGTLIGTALNETVPIYEPSAQKLEVIVTQKANPASGVLVTFNNDSLSGNKPYWSGSTDANGRVFPPKLPPGNYTISAEAGRRGAELYINVIRGKPERATLVMKLFLPRIGEAEDAPVASQVKDFRGLVLDISGSVIPQAEVEVFRKDDADAGPVLQLQSDDKGEFAAHLDSGSYVARFYARGFEPYVAVFEVTEGGDELLRVTLQVGRVAYYESLKRWELDVS